MAEWDLRFDDGAGFPRPYRKNTQGAAQLFNAFLHVAQAKATDPLPSVRPRPDHAFAVIFDPQQRTIAIA
jgi:hypothetical protein